jgi:hypothetical protein
VLLLGDVPCYPEFLPGGQQLLSWADHAPAFLQGERSVKNFLWAQYQSSSGHCYIGNDTFFIIDGRWALI